MDFKLPKLAGLRETNTDDATESSRFGHVTARSVLKAISTSISERKLGCTYRYCDSTFHGFPGCDIDSASSTLFIPATHSYEGPQRVPVVGSNFCVTNQGLDRAFVKLSKLELEQTPSEASVYKMPRRAPRKRPRKHFDIASCAKDFMKSVADTPYLRRSRTNIVKDFALARRQTDKQTASNSRLDFLKTTSVADLLQSPLSGKTSSAPAMSAGEQGKVLLPALRPKGKIIRRAGASFLNRAGESTDAILSSSSLQSLETLKQCQSKQAMSPFQYLTSIAFSTQKCGEQIEHDSKLEYLKITKSGSVGKLATRKTNNLCDKTNSDCYTKNNEWERIEMRKTELAPDSDRGTRNEGDIAVNEDLITAYYETSEFSPPIKEPEMDAPANSEENDAFEHSRSPSEEEFFSAGELIPDSCEISSKGHGREFPKRRKLSNPRYRLSKAQKNGEVSQATSDAKRKHSTSVTGILPPISTSDLVVNPASHSARSLRKVRRMKVATDADDEQDSRTSFNLNRPKRYRKQPQSYSSGSETEDTSRFRAKRRKRRKRFKKSTATDGQSNTGAISKFQNVRRERGERCRIPFAGEAVETPETARSSSSGSKDKSLFNTTSESENVISRHISDLTKRGRFLVSDPADGDDELDDDQCDFSKVLPS